MAIGSGIGASVGIGDEATWGTAGTITKWYEFEKENLVRSPKRVDSKGLSAGNLLKRGAFRVTTSNDFQGSVSGSVFTKGMGHWIDSFMGAEPTPTLVATKTLSYKQTHTLSGIIGTSKTIQIGRPDLTGTVRPYTFTGAKCTAMKLECGVDELLSADFTFDGKAVDDTTSLTAATYQTGNAPFHFAQSSLLIGAYGSEASVTGVRKVTVNFARGMKADRFYVGNAGAKAEQVTNDFVGITGTLDTDFIDPAVFVNLVRDDTPKSLIWTFTGSSIETGQNYTFAVNLPQVRFEAPGDPTVGGPDVITPSINFTSYYDDSHLPSIVLVSTDTAL